MAGAEDVNRAEDPAAPPETARQAEPKAYQRDGGRTGLKIGGWILAVLGGLLVISGVALVIIHLTQRSGDGYYTSPTETIGAPGYAVTAEGLHIADVPGFATNAIGRVRVTARSSNGQTLFVGIGPQSAVNTYLAGVARSEVTDVNGDTVTYKMHGGRAPAGPPSRQAFWRSASSGSGQVTASWKVKSGTWTVVLMNDSAAAPVRATVSMGVKTNLLLWIGLGLLVVGLIAGGGGTAMLLSSRRPRAAIT
jgi:hypothetical protein